jgi:hypothetical protein
VISRFFGQAREKGIVYRLSFSYDGQARLIQLQLPTPFFFTVVHMIVLISKCKLSRHDVNLSQNQEGA